MSIRFAELTVSHNNTGLFSTVCRWFGREDYFTPESVMVFLFDDGEVRDIDANHEDPLYSFTYLTAVNAYYPSYFEKIAKNAGCEAVGVRGLTGEGLSSKVNDCDTYFCRRPEQIEGISRLDFRNLFKEPYKNKHIPSLYNCIYYCYCHSKGSMTKNDVFSILRCKSTEQMPRFEIAYDTDKFTKDEVIQITRKLLLGNN